MNLFITRVVVGVVAVIGGMYIHLILEEKKKNKERGKEDV